MNEDKPKPKTGRPTVYSAEAADAICLGLMEGKGLREICAPEHMPAISTVMLWVSNNHPEFVPKYRLAREVQDDVDFDDIRHIADTPLIGEKTIIKGDKIETIVGDNVERSKLMLHGRQWRLARRNGKKFGDKIQQEHSGPGGGPIQVNNVSLTDAERAERIAAIFDAGRARRDRQDPGDAEDLGAATGTADPGVRDDG